MCLIGIVGRVSVNKDEQDIIQVTDAIRKAMMIYDDILCISLLPTEKKSIHEVIPGDDVVDKKIDFILDKCDAFIIPGGTDFYKFDEYVINYAINNDKPLLAICLGFQCLCSMFAQFRNKHEMVRLLENNSHCGQPNSYQHDVLIKKNSLLYDIVGLEQIPVNSVHHYVVDFPIDRLKVNAEALDGIIEGVEYPGKRFIMGLQWHPEYLMDNNSIKIFDKFVDVIIASHND